MQLLYARVTQAIAGTSNFREVAEVAFTAGADAPWILDALVSLGIGGHGANIETGLSGRSKLVALPAGRSLNDPDWSVNGLKLWVLTRH
jgi:hypothetical protein